MTKIFHSLLWASIIFIILSGCMHTGNKPVISHESPPVVLDNRTMEITLVPENKTSPSYILYKKTDRFSFGKENRAAFKLDLLLSPLMRNAVVHARVEKKGHLVREYTAKKASGSEINDKKGMAIAPSDKLVLFIPFLKENEKVVVTTSYEWMDPRFTLPLFFEDDWPAHEARATVDIPFGTTLHFKAAKRRENIDFSPANSTKEHPQWINEDNKTGLGTRFTWEHKNGGETLASKADALQLFLAFESPMQSEKTLHFSSWDTVGSYLYNRIERYDMPSNEIREFIKNELATSTSDQDKIKRIFSYLRTIEKRTIEQPLFDQRAQPATRTYARKYGTSLDIAILGRAMLISAGLGGDIIAVSDRRFNPRIKDFYSPVFFSNTILSAEAENKVYYFDPDEKTARHELSRTIQGEFALSLKQKGGIFFTLPFESAEKNTETYTYQLWLNDNGFLEGDYAVDVTGFHADKLYQHSWEKLKSMSPEDLQAFLTDSDHSQFSFATVDHISNESGGIRLSGQTKPVLLSRNNNGNYAIALEKIVTPTIAVLSGKNRQDFSGTTVISLYIDLPENAHIASLPKNVAISVDEINGRFSVTHRYDQLIVEGILMISKPITKFNQEKLDRALKEVMAFGEQNIALFDKASEGTHDAKAPSVLEENS